VRYYAKAQGKAKTDPLDTQVIGDFARSFRPPPTPAPDPVRRELTELLQVAMDSLAAERRSKIGSGSAGTKLLRAKSAA
jgi:hypothetical protein